MPDWRMHPLTAYSAYACTQTWRLAGKDRAAAGQGSSSVKHAFMHAIKQVNTVYSWSKQEARNMTWLEESKVEIIMDIRSLVMTVRGCC